MKKRGIILALLMVLALGMTGCTLKITGTGANEKEQETEAKDKEEEEEEKEEDKKEEVKKEDDEEDEIVDMEIVDEPEEDDTDVNSSADAGNISSDWMNMEFIFDGKSLALPCSYADLAALGWTFDLAEYGYENGYIMNPGDKTYGTIYLENPSYNEDVTLMVGFINTGSEPLDITECDIWTFNYETTYGHNKLDNVPAMTVANGITIGSTKEDVIAAFGECPEEDMYVSDSGYVIFSYAEESATYYMDITIYDEHGVTEFDISTYE